ncbi:hypothetical protein Droror1_Dr00028037 [Drosera rotundifolia]
MDSLMRCPTSVILKHSEKRICNSEKVGVIRIFRDSVSGTSRILLALARDSLKGRLQGYSVQRANQCFVPAEVKVDWYRLIWNKSDAWKVLMKQARIGKRREAWDEMIKWLCRFAKSKSLHTRHKKAAVIGLIYEIWNAKNTMIFTAEQRKAKEVGIKAWAEARLRIL